MSTSRPWKLWCCLCLVGGVTLIAPHLEKEDNQSLCLCQHHVGQMGRRSRRSRSATQQVGEHAAKRAHEIAYPLSSGDTVRSGLKENRLTRGVYLLVDHVKDFLLVMSGITVLDLVNGMVQHTTACNPVFLVWNEKKGVCTSKHRIAMFAMILLYHCYDLLRFCYEVL